MRALCGAVISAGAMIGLGLLSIGLGMRYAAVPVGPVGSDNYVHFGQLDTPLMYAMVLLIVVAVIGLGVAFFGLAYHHERRHRERLRELGLSSRETVTPKG